MKFSRRSTLGLLIASSAGATFLRACSRTGNRARHVLPSVTSDSLSVSVSLERPANDLRLTVDGTPHKGRQTDSKGRFWTFHVDRLMPETTYELELHEGDVVVEAQWPLKTFPARGARPETFRLMTYTCAGGGDGFGRKDLQFFKPHGFRQKLFDQGLAQNPDAVLAIGDHIYYDLKGQSVPRVGKGLIRVFAGIALRWKYGSFDRTKPIIGTKNEKTLKKICDEQIADLYGTRFKSVPVFFLPDDHDYFENDDANEERVTFPPDEFSANANKAIADLYYPPLPNAPSEEVNRKFGILRYGSLFEAPLFDCAGLLTVDGDEGGLVPPEIEDWIIGRISNSDTKHFALVPSHPMGWTAGKWREWYPDVVAPEGHKGTAAAGLMEDAPKGKLTTQAKKYLWPLGWWKQHQRLLSALYRREGSRFMFSGDIHAQGALEITSSGDLSLDDRPVTSVLVGPVSTSDATWPSAARGIAAEQPEWLKVRHLIDTKEVNGFAILEVDSTKTKIDLHDCGGKDRSLDEDGRTQRIEELTLQA